MGEIINDLTTPIFRGNIDTERFSNIDRLTVDLAAIPSAKGYR